MLRILAGKTLPRRTLLKGVGASLALPFLDAMFPAFGLRGQSAPERVHRFQTFYVPNGMHMPLWKPQTPGKNFELSEIMGVLEPFRVSDVDVDRDLAAPAAEPASLASMIDENTPDGAGRGAEEMPRTLPLNAALVHEPQVSCVSAGMLTVQAIMYFAVRSPPSMSQGCISTAAPSSAQCCRNVIIPSSSRSRSPTW